VDSPENLRKKHFGRKVVFHLRAVNPAWIPTMRALSGVHEVEQVDEKLIVSLEEPEQMNPEIIRSLVAQGADVLFVGELRHSLEDIYLQTIQESQEEVIGA
jgi:ABC-2 type transport system ATP-binding protein